MFICSPELPYEGVQKVDKVAEIVDNGPGDGVEVLQLPEDAPPDDKDEVVHDGHVDEA